MREVKMGIIGAGPRGAGLAMVYRTVPGCRITAVCDRIDRLAASLHAALGDGRITCYTDHRRLLREADIDAVFIAVEPERNAELVIESLQAEKHVMCEVPLAYSLDECLDIVQAVEASGLKFQLAEQMRYQPFVPAWRQMVSDRRLGKVLFAEGEYLHGMTDDRYWLDRDTGERLDYRDAAQHPRAMKSRLWNLTHPILYLPHELSPLLHILDDRVVRVSCMATRRPGYRHDWFPVPDIEVALMHTAGDTLLRLAAGFTVQTVEKGPLGYHWMSLLGTDGMVETNRSRQERMKMWLPNEMMRDPAQVEWEYPPHLASASALESGHGGTDYYPMAAFVRCILDDTAPPVDVYRAVETAAPAIVAARSADEGGACLEVPDFRPAARQSTADDVR